MEKIPLAKMYIDNEIEEAVIHVLRSGIYVNGEFNKQFEQKFADFCSTKFAVTTNSGTSALFLALMALGIGKGDEVIVPSHTYIASVSSILHLNAIPIFVDIDPKTFNIDVKKIENVITKRTKAIIPVHLYGHPAEMDRIMEIAEHYDLKIIEDACQAHGTEYKGKKVGTLGDIGCFSFYPSKNMTVSGDGGMVTTNNEELALKISMLRDQGVKEKYLHELLGFNFRLSELHATIGIHQLKHLPLWIEQRRKIATQYNEFLEDIKQVVTPIEYEHVKHVYHLYVIRTKQRDKLRNYLHEHGISTGIHYPIPVHKQPCITRIINNKYILKETEKCVEEILSLPIYPQLEKKKIEYISKKIMSFYITN